MKVSVLGQRTNVTRFRNGPICLVGKGYRDPKKVIILFF
jgi:hypothetical protein